MKTIKLLSGKYIVIDNSAVKLDEWCIEMYNEPTKAELSYVDEEGNKWYLRKMNMNCGKNDPECKKVIKFL